MRKRINLIILGMIVLMGLFASVSATEQNYCCEKTKAGAYCINSVGDNCNEDYRMSPTSCEATGYCKMGTCYDKLEGTCMKNTPQRVCQDQEGIWQQGNPEDIPSCQLGCCLIGDQAAFVTSVRCNRLNSIYGLDINFRTDIASEVQCIASATSDVKGACVFEVNFQNSCKFTTKRECTQIQGGDFHEGYLCSHPDLNACGPSENTICVEGRDEVYFKDTCGNVANVYDASKLTDKEYWSKIYDVSESCGYGESNVDSKTCGNCDYYMGSTCKKDGGKNICKDLGCTWQGERYEHGETWCAGAKGVSKIISFNEEKTDPLKENLPGSRYFRLVCYNAEVTIEPCADYRQEVCTQSELNGFATSVCRVNRWQDCYSQKNIKDCENLIKRDCQWMSGIKLNKGTTSTTSTIPSTITGKVVSGENEVMLSSDDGGCVPRYPPGFDFWEAGSDSTTICSQASMSCTVTWEEGITGKPICKSGCECIANNWASDMAKSCSALGDCGVKTNYLGVQGYNTKTAIKKTEK